MSELLWDVCKGGGRTEDGKNRLDPFLAYRWTIKEKKHLII